MFDCTYGSSTWSLDQRARDYDAEELASMRKWLARRERGVAPPSVLELLESARRGLAAAGSEASAGGRYVGAHRAASRAAAAVLAARCGAPASGRGSRSVWELLPQVEPALSEWAAYFAAGAGKRAAAEAGLSRAVSPRDADDLLRDAETFVSIAENAVARRASQAADR
jgi:hypothetical protein